jgi:hypothetical protein
MVNESARGVNFPTLRMNLVNFRTPFISRCNRVIYKQSGKLARTQTEDSGQRRCQNKKTSRKVCF